MDKDKDIALVQDFPILYRERKGDKWTVTPFGFECGDGWEPLIRHLSEKLEGWNREHLETPVVAAQVKEKFGGLRFYVNGPSEDRVLGWIAAAEAASLRTCEDCGSQEGVTTTAGGRNWIRTLCPACREAWELNRGRRP